MIIATREAARCFLGDETGATAIEYSIIAAILGIAVVGTLGGISTSLNTTFEKVGTTMAANNTPTP